MKKTTPELQTELEAVIAWFESDEMNIDEAAEQYERGQKLARELEKRLMETKNTINKLRQTFSD
jgi:exodeoxyribonuclease VII small subunit